MKNGDQTSSATTKNSIYKKYIILFHFIETNFDFNIKYNSMTTSRSLLSLKVYFQPAGKHSFWLVTHWIEGEPKDTHVNFKHNKER